MNEQEIREMIREEVRRGIEVALSGWQESTLASTETQLRHFGNELGRLLNARDENLTWAIQELNKTQTEMITNIKHMAEHMHELSERIAEATGNGPDDEWWRNGGEPPL